MTTTELWTSFAARADAHPEVTALVAGDRFVSYGELTDMALRAIPRLRSLDLLPGEPVAVEAAKTPETIAVVLAGMACRTPVVLPSLTLPPTTRTILLDRAGARHLVSETGTAPADPPPPLDAGHSQPRPPGRLDTAIILTTSGSTGIPKLVPIATGAIERFADWAAARFDITSGAVVLNYAPLNFDLCLLDVWTTLHHGGTVVLVDTITATHGDRLLDLLDTQGVTVLQAVPMAHQLMIRAARGSGRSIPSVRHVMFTGDHLPPHLLPDLQSLFPAGRRYNLYGCTETNNSFIHELPAGATPSQIPLGEPLPDVDAIIVDESGQVLAGEGRGELVVSTPYQTAGYLGSTAAGAGPFIEADPSWPTAGTRPLYRTGDIVRRDHLGALHLEGRNDAQVKVRGTRVNMAAVERTLLDHDDVAEVAVVATPDSVAGHVLNAVLRPGPDATINTLDLRRHCAGTLPTAAIPGCWQVTDGPLPRTSTGKIDRESLRHTIERAQAGTGLIGEEA